MTHRVDDTRMLTVGALARVEGEGSLHVVARDGRVSEVQLRIYEPPRFFEAMLRGRGHTEPPDITARICGICPVAYQMSACQAIESACGVVVDGQLRALRRLLYCGEWIESHALHIYLLHAPDFLGYPSAIELAADHREIVERGLHLKQVGNRVMEVVGGRAIHPVNVRLGGFYRTPSRSELHALADPLRRALDAAIETARWAATFEFPDVDGDWNLVSLRHPDEYPIDRGRIVSAAGLDIDVASFREHFTEDHVEHSTALHGRALAGGVYAVGPLARYSNNFDRLPVIAQQVAREVGLGSECRNPFRSILVRAVEVVFACDEALRLIAAYEPPPAPFLEVPPRAAVGHGATEAPRGLLYHRYALESDGTIADALIVPPTAQNQPAIERDLRRFIEPRLHLDDAELTRQCEQAIRNHDPCISCATHFLDLTVQRT